MIQQQVIRLILALLLCSLSFSTWAASQPPTSDTGKTTYILVIDSSGSMKEGSKDPSQYFDPARQQTRWDFMLDSVQRFLESLENDTVVHLILFRSEEHTSELQSH